MAHLARVELSLDLLAQAWQLPADIAIENLWMEPAVYKPRVVTAVLREYRGDLLPQVDQGKVIPKVVATATAMVTPKGLTIVWVFE